MYINDNHFSMSNFLTKLDWNDTFLSMTHLKKSFPDMPVEHSEKAAPVPPYKITFPAISSGSVKRKQPSDEGTESANENAAIKVEGHIIPNRGPYPANQPKKNAVPFTPTQVS